MEPRPFGVTAEQRPDGDGAVSGSARDPVLVALGQAEALYGEQRADWECRLADEHETVRETRAELENTRQINGQLSQSLEAAQVQLEQERGKAERHRRRADQLAVALKEIHRSLVAGDVYALILKACLSLTDASRGVYLSLRLQDNTFRLRAAVNVDGYPQAPPSEFLQALCRKVLESRTTLVCNGPSEFSDLPQPVLPGERFRNCLAAPVVLLADFHGIIIAADRNSGEFDRDDVETLLSIGDQAAIAVENLHLQQELQRTYVATVSMLADAVEAKDAYTGGHCEMVSHLAHRIAQRLNLTEEEQSVVCYAALLHDVGKIAVSDGVLNKPGPLLPEERELVRSHVRVGHDLIKNVPALEQVADVVLHHHEWYDGTGYPDGLKGEDIPIGSRIVCAVDSYSAIVTRRSYKPAYSAEQARSELIRCSGGQFDPRVIEAFLAVLDTAEGDGLTEEGLGCGLLPGFRAPGGRPHPLH